jgi:hypothetical protein
MSAREVIRHALSAYYADSPNPALLVDTLMANHRAEVLHEAAAVAESTIALFPTDTDWGSAIAGSMEGLAHRLRGMAGSPEKSSPDVTGEVTG